MTQALVRRIPIATILFAIPGSALAADAFNRPGAYVGLGMAGGLSEFDGAGRLQGADGTVRREASATSRE
jgi:hypothetical protein